MSTITAADIKLLASARMNDLSDGGGAMVGTALQDGVENNVFPDISAVDRAWGKLAMRLVYPAVLNEGIDALLGANVCLDDMPDDTTVGAFLLGAASTGETREDALLRLQQSHWAAVGPEGTWSTATRLSSTSPVSPGTVVYTNTAASGAAVYEFPVLILTATSAGTNLYDVTFAGEAPSSRVGKTTKQGGPSPAAPWLASTQTITGTLASGATFADLPTLLVPVVPVAAAEGATPGATGQIGIDPGNVTPAGRAAAFRGGQVAIVHHTAEVAAATYANGASINCGRTGLASVRVIGANGVEITTGYTANLTNGVVNVVSIAGWSQPVVVRHRIEEVLGISRTGYPEVRGGVSSYSGSASTVGPFALSVGATYYVGRPGVGSVRVISQSGQDITDLYGPTTNGVNRYFSINLAAGTVDFVSALGAGMNGSAASAFIASHSPVTLVVRGTSANTTTATEPQATLNRVTFNRALTRAFPAGTKVSTTLLLGDLQSSVGDDFSQQTWTNVWSDDRVGAAIAAQYDQAAHPITTNNAGAVTTRWALVFTTATTFAVISEDYGQLGVGNINSDLALENPATGAPYFTLRALGWGLGWSAGNVLRFDTFGATFPCWACRSVMPSAPNPVVDSVTLAIRGDLNA